MSSGVRSMRSLSITLPILLVACMALLGCRSELENSAATSIERVDDLDIEATPVSTLTVGDPAPPISISQWVLGDPVDQSLGGGVHVVEFWATWCGPCRVGMPHISELQQHHGDDVAFIGVTSEDLDTVTGFLEEESSDGKLWKDVIQYRIAIDENEQTGTAYMKAAGQNGIPTAFIVGPEGIVEWIGHPGRIDEPLQQVVDGSWNRDEAIAEFRQQQRLSELQMKLREWAMSENWDQALSALDEIETETGPSAGLLMTRLSILQNAGREDEAAPLREKVIELAWDDAGTLNGIAWSMATSGEEDRLPLALRASERAAELSKNKDAAILDTVARAHYEIGNLDEAIKWQRLAVEQNDGYQEIDDTLQEYLDEKARDESESSESESESEESPADDSGDGGESPTADSPEPEVNSPEPEADSPEPDADAE